MHILAYVYHWSREEVWHCPVTERKKWVDLIEEQKKAESGKLDNTDTGYEKSSNSYREGIY